MWLRSDKAGENHMYKNHYLHFGIGKVCDELDGLGTAHDGLLIGQYLVSDSGW